MSGPFFSPDGEWIGFYSFSDGQLKKIAITGGTSIRLCDAVPPGGASWSGDGSILFSQPEGIMRVSENGGEPTLLIATAEGEQAASPQLLPGGDEVLFSLASTAGGNRWNEGQVVVESLGTDDRKVVVEGGSDGTYVPTGHVVYALENVLFAVPFDLSRLERTGGPVAVLDPVKRALGGASANYGFSAGGTLVYVPRAGGAAGSARHLVWVDRDGNETNLTQEPGSYQFPRVSPDGRRIAFEIIREGSGTEIGLIEISSGNYSQLTFTDGGEQNPTWTPDARRLLLVRLLQLGTISWGQAAVGCRTHGSLLKQADKHEKTRLSWADTRRTWPSVDASRRKFCAGTPAAGERRADFPDFLVS